MPTTTVQSNGNLSQKRSVGNYRKLGNDNDLEKGDESSRNGNTRRKKEEDIPSFAWNGKAMVTSKAEREEAVDRILYGNDNESKLGSRNVERSIVNGDRVKGGGDGAAAPLHHTEPTRSQVVASHTSHTISATDSSLSRMRGKKGKRPSRLKAQPAMKRLDEFGFIVNLDDQGHLRRESSAEAQTQEKKKELRDSSDGSRKNQSRERKWNKMLNNWDKTKARRQKKLRRRLRKGVPNAVRGAAWAQLADVPNKIDFQNKGQYERLITEAEAEDTGTGKGHTTMDTIDRDINRTFPRHSMFFEDRTSELLSDLDYALAGDDVSDDSDDDNSLPSSLGAHNSTADELTASQFNNVLDPTQCGPAMVDLVIRAGAGGKVSANVEHNDKVQTNSQNEAADSPTTALSTIVDNGQTDADDSEADVPIGHIALRRVLRAYSVYDREVGYCQGMNFIAAMFITFMTEEEAFWLLVSVMNEEPCKMRGLFGSGMTETREVLFIAEKLIRQFLPKLSVHLERESVDITMFATQWFLTLYTSSFPFGLVTRVWDIFLAEGWKVVYRVMLAILDFAASDLLKLKFEEILGYFRVLPKKVTSSYILKAAFKIPLKTKHIEKYEAEWRSKQGGKKGGSRTGRRGRRG